MDQTQITMNGKRKSAGEAAAAYYDYGIVPPRFISCKMMRMTIAPPRPKISWAVEPPAEASFASLPRELFCNIVAYLGPTSSSLCILNQVSRDHNVIMTTIGDVMLERARMRFRTPLPLMSEGESSVSLFVRHARVSKAVHDRLEVLNRVLRKEFPIIESSALPLEDTTKLSPFDFLSNHSDFDLNSTSRDRMIVVPSEVNYALNVALCLLGCWKQHYFDDPHEAQEIAEVAATTALEWRVSSLCSVLGAKAYKYAKSRMCRRYEREDELLSAYAVTDQMPLDYECSDDEEDDMSIDSTEFEDDEDMAILDKASLVMQHVVLSQRQTASWRSFQATAIMSARQA
jgi:hypothetical protein